ncbi:MAG: hypothetical protein NFCOHLIN_01332 [Gammaproteobacteria bacterium]|nr:hypothetical protein [Gammaproteobacteria bacterium]
MSRRRSGLLDDLLDIASALPWWVDCVLAAVAYLVLHHISLKKVPVTSAPGQLGEAMAQTFGVTLASIGQYVIPAIFLVGAVISVSRRIKREGLLSRVTAKSLPAISEEITWREFEMLVGEFYRTKGYRVEERGGAGSDGGVDLVLRSDTETVLVQCKHWNARTVGIKVLRELYGVLVSEGASRAVLITSGQVSEEAAAFCRDKPFESPRVLRRLQLLREWSHEQVKQVFT